MDGFEPDFENLRNMLLCRDRKHVPVIELIVDRGYKEKFFKREPRDFKDELDFSLKNYHDFTLIHLGMLKPAATIGKNTEKDGVKWADESDGLIRTIDDFEDYEWYDPTVEDYSIFPRTKALIPDDMGILTTTGKIFTASWMLMGFDNFCISIYENYPLIKKVFEKIGKIQFEVFKNIIETKSIGAIAAVDDIAYSEGLMISSDIFRDNLFPWYKKMGEICKKNQIPFIYHSDGNILEIIDDLIDCGFTAIHPVEEKAMSIREVYKKYGGSLCLLGNIDMDVLIRCEPGDVRKLVMKNLQDIAADGFYACGSGNSVAAAVSVDNYNTLVETTRRYGKYPIHI